MPSTVATGEKIKRELWQTWIKPNVPEGEYEVIGEDLEEFNVEMNATVETKKNILGANSINVTGYEKQASVSPYVAVKGSPLFDWLKSIFDDEKKLDEVKTTVVNVDLFEDETSGAYPAVEEDVFIELVNYGGDTEALKIEYNIHFTGIKRKGTFNITTGAFTETESA